MLMGLLYCSGNVYAQLSLLVDSPTSLQACGETAPLLVQLLPTSLIADSIVVQVELPVGVDYVVGSEALVLNDVGALLQSDATAPSNMPRFVIHLPSPISIGTSLVLSFERTANCEAVSYAQSGGIFQDNIYVWTNVGEVDGASLPYSVLYGALTMFNPFDMSGTAGETISQTLTILNGGFGCVDSVEVKVRDMSVINFANTPNAFSVTVGGVEVPWEVVDFCQTEIDPCIILHIVPSMFNGVGNGNACLDDGETLNIVFHYTSPINCNNAVVLMPTYAANWGCNTESCGNEVSQNALITFQPLAVPAVMVGVPMNNNINTCGTGGFDITINNTSATNAALNIAFDAGWQAPNGNFLTSGDLVFSFDMLINGQNYSSIEQYAYQSFNFSANTNPNIGLVDADQDGFYDDLAPSASLQLSVNNVDLSCEDISCGQDLDYFWGIKGVYNNFCGTASNNFSSGYNYTRFYLLTSTAQASGALDMWNNNTTEEFTFCHTLSYSLNCPSDSIYFAIELPPGFVVAPDTMPAWYVTLYNDTPVPLNIEQDGSTVYLNGFLANNFACIHLLLQLQCLDNTPPQATIQWSSHFICDEACGCSVPLACGSIDVQTHSIFGASCNNEIEGTVCAIPDGTLASDDVCLTPLSMTAQRVQYGYTDYDFTQIVDLNNDAIASNSAYTCDSIVVKSKGAVIGNEALLIDNAHLRIVHYSPDVFPLLEHLRTDVILYDHENQQTYTTAAPIIPNEMVQGANGYWINDIDLTPLLSMLENEALGVGDSIWTTTYFEAQALNNDFDLIADLTHFRLTYFTYYNNGEIFGCDHIGQKFFVSDAPDYLNAQKKSNYQARLWLGDNLCGEESIYFDLKAGLGGDIFPQEIRPDILIDSINVILPDGVSYVPNSSYYSCTPNPLQIAVEPVVMPLFDGRTLLSYYNSGNFPQAEYISTEGPSLSIGISSNCQSATQYELLEGSYFYRNKAYSHNTACMEAWEKSDVALYHPYSVQTYTAPISNSIEAVPVATRFDVNSLYAANIILEAGFYNGTQYVFPNSFFIVSLPANNISIEAVEGGTLSLLDDGNYLIKLDSLPPTSQTYNGNMTFVSYQQNFSFGYAGVVRLHLAVSSCENETPIQLYAGWDCSAYPTSLDGISCNRNTMVGTAIVPETPTEIQLSLQSPATAVDLCETVSFTLTVNSAQLGSLFQPIVTFDYPPLGGIILSGTATIEYPLGTPPRAFTPVFSDNGIVFDLSAADMLLPVGGIAAQGILGTALGSNEQRKAKINFNATTNCDFVAGSSLRATGYGKRSCGSAAIGNGVSQLFVPLQIAGVGSTHDLLLHLLTDNISCSDSMNWHIQIAHLNGTPVGDDELLYIYLPEGVSYIPNTTSSNGATMGEPSQTTLPTQQEVLTYQLPVGIAAADVVDLYLAVDVQDIDWCSNFAADVLLQSVVNQDVVCVSDNSLCSMRVQTNVNDGYFSLSNPFQQLTLMAANANIYCRPVTDSLAFNYVLSNNSTVDFEGINIAVYVDSNDDGIFDTTDSLLTQQNLNSLHANAEVSQDISVLWNNPNLLPLFVVAQPLGACGACSNAIDYLYNYNFVEQAAISGMVWLDDNANFVYDAGETLVSNIPLEIENENNTAYYTNTNADGNYTKAVPINHNYTVVLTSYPPNYILPEAFANQAAVMVNDCKTAYTRDIPLQPCSNVINISPVCSNGSYEVALTINQSGYTDVWGTINNSFYSNNPPIELLSDPLLMDEPYNITVWNGNCELSFEGIGTTLCAALPVSLLQFNGQIKDTHHELFWDIAEEINTEQYLVERSKGNNGDTWTKVAAVNAQHKSHYQTIDPAPLAGSNYYRLSGIDYNGKKETLAHLLLQRTSDVPPMLSIVPTVSRNNITINWQNMGKAAQMRLIDTYGRVLLTRSIDSSHSLSLDIQHYSAGVYFVELSSENAQVRQSFLKTP